MAEAHEFEVRCPSCDVSFPVGTRRCLHCGGRTGPPRFQVAGMPAELVARDAAAEAEYSMQVGDDEAPPPLGDPEPRKARGGWMNAGGSLLWIGMAVVFAIMRACGEG